MLRFFKSWLSVNGEGEWKKDDRQKKHARIIQWSEKLTWAYTCSSGEIPSQKKEQKEQTLRNDFILSHWNKTFLESRIKPTYT